MDIKPAEEFLLDLFAKDALGAIIAAAYSSEEGYRIATKAVAFDEKVGAFFARQAYDMAEFMVLERRKRLEK